MMALPSIHFGNQSINICTVYNYIFGAESPLGLGSMVIFWLFRGNNDRFLRL